MSEPVTTDLFGEIAARSPREFQPKPRPDPEQIAAKLAEEAAAAAHEEELTLAQEIVEAIYRVDKVQCRAREVRPDSELAQHQFSPRLRAWVRGWPLVTSRESNLARLRDVGVPI